ncbi:unnamed protein product [Protopolystoma xenopodis]|uniref:Uncharacterized protein n=1 Tax=Protopolystoma xenopodis TaxID=117903 RepID=A0A3S5BBR9_9PLAT|nr:unnamed protein product [Protopolystoma xenopodis]
MTKLTNDADYDAGETFKNVPTPLSDDGNHDNYYGRRLRARCVLLCRPDNKTKMRQRDQPTFKNYFCLIDRSKRWRLTSSAQ